MRKLIFVLGILLVTQSVRAAYSQYRWEEKRSPYVLTPAESEFAEYVLKQHTQYDYALENDRFYVYYTTHRIVKVSSTEAIEKHNRIYIAAGNNIDLVEVKARSINKDGKVVNFDSNNLKELKDEQSGKGYRIFAIEGVEIGSEVEFYYTIKKYASIFDRVYMQFEVPVRSSTFRLTCPSHLRFDFKSYNGYGKITSEEGEETNVYTAEASNIPGLKEEEFASYGANRQRVELKLAYNVAKSKARLYTWEEAAKTFYRVLDPDAKEQKAVDKFIKDLKDNPKAPMVDRIKNVELKLKTTIQVNDDGHSDQLDNLEAILKYKLASKAGMTKLFFAVFQTLQIPCQPVLTCSREKVKFDEEFDSWDFLDDYLLNFPETGGFIAPYVFALRYPVVPPDFTAQKGLFIEPFTIGEVKTALAKVRDIPAVDYTVNMDNQEISVSFDQAMATANVNYKRTFTGLNASFVAPYYEMVNETDRKNMIEELMKQTAPDITIKDWKANVKGDDFSMDVNFTSTHFIETAGPRVLFKVGELIGPQVEMYRDDKRMMPVENDFNRGYDRVIKVAIPDGYQIKNPDDIKLNVVYTDGDKQPYLFVSDYVLNGKEMVITIKEYYKDIYAPLTRYEDFRKVINAAADFNKIILVFDKKR